MNGELPQGWRWAKMLDFLDYEGGSQPPKKEFIYEPRKGYVRLVQIRDFGNKPFPTYVPDSKRLKKVTRDDLLLARYGGSSGSDSLGRICTGLEGAYNVALAKLIFPCDLLEKGYVRYLFLGPWFREKVSQNSRSCQTGFNREDVEDIEFPIAPHAEQRRIVAKLEKLLGQVDACQQRLTKIPVLLKRFRQSVLAAACSGSLTADWRDAFSASTDDARLLVAKIESERRKLKSTRVEKFLSPIDPDEEPWELPSKWFYARLGNICSQIADIDHKMPKAVSKGVKFISAKDLLDDGTLNLTQDIKLISEADYERLSRKAKPQRYDIIYSRIGARLGKARLVETDERFLVSYSCCVIRPLIVLPAYLVRFLDSGVVLARAREESKSIGVPDLGLEQINNFVVPVPPLVEQQEIVRRVEKLFALADQIEARFAEAKKRVEVLTQSILAKAFRGELVPTEFELAKAEGRSFESAEELLERVKGDGDRGDKESKASATNRGRRRGAASLTK